MEQVEAQIEFATKTMLVPGKGGVVKFVTLAEELPKSSKKGTE